MATSVYFNNYNSAKEQHVVEDLIVESIKIMGFDAYYIPIFNEEDRDILYGEDPVKKFKSAFPVEMYLSSALEYGGEREFFSKFGLEIKNNVTVILSKRSFSQRVPQEHFTRPREGDLIYVPFLNGTGELFEIKFADHTKDFFTLGRKIPYFYELQLEKFKYSQEVVDTGIDAIDNFESLKTFDIEVLKNGKVTEVYVSKHGYGYETPPTLKVGYDWEEDLTVTVGQEYCNGSRRYIVTTAGTFGATAPTHSAGTVENGTAALKYVGTRATAECTVSGDGKVYRATVLTSGSGYTSNPVVTFTLSALTVAPTSTSFVDWSTTLPFICANDATLKSKLATIATVFFMFVVLIKKDRKSTRLNSSHTDISRMPSSA